ncbi:GyrI-like domain-containing protein [Bacillus sp. FJAT-49732]|uniref:GyrI-like domain-containing protein n=1 Tax=Lederbergia citrisecunda TaxID=2833583 RepID=A0A942TIX8_9BACI|nr:GyrI-like domain-containing protein [Lederbergia citrisecunda]MBS4198383.1 GyrI-like domain-containing protein [Lederbergia citrisecunda]
MEAVIVNQSKTFTLFGFSKQHDQNRAYSETMFELLDKVWAEVRNNNLSHKGINHVVYDANHIVFAGIELNSSPSEDSSLEEKIVHLDKYAYCKHIGPYSELDKSYRKIESIIETSGEHHQPPSMEIYGHWNEDESKLETEIIFNIK